MLGKAARKMYSLHNITGVLPNLLCKASLKAGLLRCWSVVAAPHGLDPPAVGRAGLGVLSGVVVEPHHT